MKPSPSKFPMRAYTAIDLARMYSVSRKTFLKWVKPFEEAIGERIGRYYTITQVKVIIEKLGMPGGYED